MSSRTARIIAIIICVVICAVIMTLLREYKAGALVTVVIIAPLYILINRLFSKK